MVKQIPKIRKLLLLRQLYRNIVMQQNGYCIKFNLAVDLSALTNVDWNSKFAMFMEGINSHKSGKSGCQ